MPSTPAPRDDLTRIADALESIASDLHRCSVSIERTSTRIHDASPALIERVREIIDQNAGKAGAALRLMKRNTHAR